MQVSRIFRGAAAVTLFSLSYIHLQIHTVNLAYTAKQKEQRIRQLTDENGHLVYKIAMMKSASHLGEKLLNEKSGLRFADSNCIVKISAEKRAKSVSPAANDNELLSLLSATPK